MKKTKIICTIGPSSSNEETLKGMIKAGMNVARINFSHGEYPSHKATIELIKKIRTEMKLPIPIMLDTKGPEFRIGTFENHGIELSDGDSFCFTTESLEGNKERVSVSYPRLAEELSVGDIILVNDGLVKFTVESKNEKELFCKVLVGGKITDRKSMSFPGKVLKQVYLSEQDKKDLLFGIENDVDFVACSFVSTAQDIIDIRNFLDANGGNNIKLIAKIENRSGVDNVEDILKYCEGIMVARGDLGVEIPYAELPSIQKKLITTCRLKGGISITATEMLESMIGKPRPTRAEISDVANAVFDGTSVVMLSGESASGKYPVEAVQAMSSIVMDAENNINFEKRFRSQDFHLNNLVDAISHSACQMALDTDAACIVACTRTGSTGRMVSRFRVPMPIVGMTTSPKAFRQLALSWNLLPVLVEEYNSTDVLFYNAMKVAKLTGFAKPGDIVITTGGMTGKSGETTLLHADVVSDDDILYTPEAI